MKLRTMLIAMLVTFSVPAVGDFVLVSKAHEVLLSDLRLPGTANGTLAFKSCRTCEYRTVRVTPATRYQANDRRFDLAAFRRALEGVPDADGTTATVLHHLESNTIEAVRVRF